MKNLARDYRDYSDEYNDDYKYTTNHQKINKNKPNWK